MRIDCCVSYFQKQLIGLLPNQSDCFFYYTPNVDVQSWSIDTIPCNDVYGINGNLNPYGYLYNLFQLDDGSFRFILSYIGTSAPTYIPAITDDIGNPVTYTLTNCCDLVCLEGTFNAPDALYFQTGYGWNWYNGVGIFNHTTVEEAIKSLYGVQTIYTATNNGDGTFYIKIDNAYVCNPPLAWSADNVTYTDMVPCGNPPTDCWYYARFNASSNFGYPTADFGQYYLDTNGTQQAFDVLNNGQNGAGALRTLMLNNDGNVAGVYNANNPVDWSYMVYYFGQDIFAPYLPLYDINGTLINAIIFQKIDNIGGYCDLVNYSVNIPYGEEFAYQFTVNNTSETYIFDYLNFPNVIYPTGTTLLDLSDNVNMEKFIQTVFGPQASYKFINNGSSYDIAIIDAIYWGELPSFYSNALNYYQFSLA